MWVLCTYRQNIPKALLLPPLPNLQLYRQAVQCKNYLGKWRTVSSNCGRAAFCGDGKQYCSPPPIPLLLNSTFLCFFPSLHIFWNRSMGEEEEE